MQAVVALENMRAAWARVKANKGAPGIDGMPIGDFPAFARTHWPAIRQALIDGSYLPQPVRRVLIPKPDGGERALGIPTVRNLLAQTPGDPDGDQQQELLASVAVIGDANGNDE